jgi:pimeloyl-ACP methyl ester carboxylesterase
VDVPLGAWGLALLLRFDIGDASDVPVFPRLLFTLDQGDPSIASWFVSKRLASLTDLNAMTIFTDASSGASPERRALIAGQATRSMFFDVVNFPTEAAARIWKVTELDASYRSPLVSDVRTLICSGTLDWNCPPFQAERLRWGLSRAAHISVVNAGHEQIMAHAVVQRSIVRFLRGEDVDSATVSWPPLRFLPVTGPATGHPALES